MTKGLKARPLDMHRYKNTKTKTRKLPKYSATTNFLNDLGWFIRFAKKISGSNFNAFFYKATMDADQRQNWSSRQCVLLQFLLECIFRGGRCVFGECGMIFRGLCQRGPFFFWISAMKHMPLVFKKAVEYVEIFD